MTPSRNLTRIGKWESNNKVWVRIRKWVRHETEDAEYGTHVIGESQLCLTIWVGKVNIFAVNYHVFLYSVRDQKLAKYFIIYPMKAFYEYLGIFHLDQRLHILMMVNTRTMYNPQILVVQKLPPPHFRTQKMILSADIRDGECPETPFWRRRHAAVFRSSSVSLPHIWFRSNKILSLLYNPYTPPHPTPPQKNSNKSDLLQTTLALVPLFISLRTLGGVLPYPVYT